MASTTRKKIVRLFFTVDDNYIPFISVTLASIVDHASRKNKYYITIIHDGLSFQSKKALKKFNDGKMIFIFFYNVTPKVQALSVKLDVRDYYTITTYYRLFLPGLFPLFNKGLYLDSDIVVNDDIAKLYFTELGDYYVAAVPDGSVQLYDEFGTYVNKVIEMDPALYFNAGVLLMNFKKLREVDLERQAFKLLEKVTFKVAQDQDILNYLCKGRTLLLPGKWNTMPLGEKQEKPALIHYNLMFKPWNLKDIMYEEYFWKYAEIAGVKEQILANREAIPQAVIDKILQSVEGVKAFCLLEASKADEYHKKINGEYKKKKKKSVGQKIRSDEVTPVLTEERQAVLARIDELERAGKFDVDVENDPPYRNLMPGDVDYLRRKFTSKVKTMWANYYSGLFFKRMIKKGQIVIDGYEGVEHLKKLKTGAIITANHFSPFDSVPLHLAVKKHTRSKRLYKIIREGNYSFPGLFGFFLRNCYTLPLATNPTVLRDLFKSIKIILEKGNLILVYPEQSMWWNYRKPKPLKPGAFLFAARNNVPVIPTFVTMRDTDTIAKDGSKVQAYTLHFLKPIYPNSELTEQENIRRMLEDNERQCKEIYESVYKTKLTYLCDEVKEEVKEDKE